MRTVKLGNTGMEVSALCLGAMYFGTRTNEAMAYRLLDQYVDGGGTFIDTANIYAHWIPEGRGGESEALLGRWMALQGNRDKLFIASKVGFDYPGTAIGLSAAQIQTECERSLKRLMVDTIDVYYAHVDDRNTPQEETLEAFTRLVEAGKVRFVGASNFRAWRLQQAKWVSRENGYVDYCCLQQRYSYLRPKHDAQFGMQVNVNDEMLDYVRARQHEFTLLGYSVLLGGAYTRTDQPLPEQYVGPDTDARLAVLRDVAQEQGATLNQIVLAWMMQNDPPAIPLIAASSTEQMQENLDALGITLSAEQLARLNAARG